MSNTWTVALTFEDEDEKDEVKRIIEEEARKQFRSPSSLIMLIVRNFAKPQATAYVPAYAKDI